MIGYYKLFSIGSSKCYVTIKWKQYKWIPWIFAKKIGHPLSDHQQKWGAYALDAEKYIKQHAEYISGTREMLNNTKQVIAELNTKYGGESQ